MVKNTHTIEKSVASSEQERSGNYKLATNVLRHSTQSFPINELGTIKLDPEPTDHDKETVLMVIEAAHQSQEALSVELDASGMIVVKNQAGQVWQLTPDYKKGESQRSFSFGRQGDISMPNNYISSQHGKIHFDGEKLSIEDDSTNGTSVVYMEKLEEAAKPEKRDQGGLSWSIGEKPRKGEDAYAAKPDQGVFAVFDGVGGSKSGQGGDAAKMAAEMVEQWNFNDRSASNPANGLRDFLLAANNTIYKKHNQQSTTTGTIVKVFRNTEGQRYAAYASVGDSRLYRLSNRGEISLLTEDEGEGRYITNGLGLGRGSVEQFSNVPLGKGDKLLLVTDGVTGDKGGDLVSPEELANVIRSSQPGQAANNLVHLDDYGLRSQQKNDDRTAVVIDIN
jgi:protein phosphatase